MRGALRIILMEAGRKQPGGRVVLRHAAVLDEENLVALRDGVQPVRDGEHRVRLELAPYYSKDFDKRNQTRETRLLLSLLFYPRGAPAP